MWIFWESKKVCGEHRVLDNKPLNTLWSEARVLVATPFAGSGFRCGVGIQLSLSRKKKRNEVPEGFGILLLPREAGSCLQGPVLML